MTARWKMTSPVGTLYLAATARGLSELYFREPESTWLLTLKGDSPAVRHLVAAVHQLEEYFAGRRTEFDVPLDVQGTDFQRRVWDELSKIPYGATCSYREVARRIANDRAVRAVGTANGRNPVSIIVPCHRVIAADGTLGGYGGGLPAKSTLLTLERSVS